MNRKKTKYVVVSLITIISMAASMGIYAVPPNETWSQHQFPDIKIVGKVISVSEFGVSGDGKTDDTASFQEALTACSNDGIQCTIDENMSVRITEPVYMWGNGSLIGNRGAKVLIDISNLSLIHI